MNDLATGNPLTLTVQFWPHAWPTVVLEPGAMMPTQGSAVYAIQPEDLIGKESDSVLDIPMDPDTNDAGAKTVREYLTCLLGHLWRHKERFSAKRPFGNSNWDYELYAALIIAGAVEGTLDEEGFVDEVDSDEADRLILEAIRGL